jgi:hypothetical protein
MVRFRQCEKPEGAYPTGTPPVRTADYLGEFYSTLSEHYVRVTLRKSGDREWYKLKTETDNGIERTEGSPSGTSEAVE